MKPNNPDAQVKGLLSLARDKSAASRESLSDVIADLFHGRCNVLSKSERMLMHAMLHALVDDVERTVRAGLQNHLRKTSGLSSPAAAASVADPKVLVAHGILLDSGVLTDQELIEVVRHRALQHQLAQSRRRGISDRLGDYLAANGHDDVMSDLLVDAESRLSDSGEVATMAVDGPVPLIDYRDLSPDLARRLCLWVSVAVREQVLENHKIDEVELDDAIERTVEEAGTVGGWSYNSGHAIGSAIEADADTAGQLLQHLRSGDILQFEALLSDISGLRPRLLSRMIYERGGESLATLCVAAGISKRSFAAIFLLSRETWPEKEEVGAQEIAQALSFYDRLNPVAAKRVVARWRRNSDYLNAIRQVSARPRAL
jgi:uncharacterized protein (DUF2336 family)